VLRRSAGVPLIVYDPRLPEPLRGRELDALVLSTDLAPTTLSLAGLEPPATMQGRDLAPLLHDRAEPWRDEIFLENLYLGRDGPLIEAVRTQRWKYVRYFNPGRGGLPGGMYPGVVDFAGRSPHFEQLFDLRADPQETSNLVAEAEHAAVVARLRKRCVDQSDELVRFARRQQVRAATER